MMDSEFSWQKVEMVEYFNVGNSIHELFKVEYQMSDTTAWGY